MSYESEINWAIEKKKKIRFIYENKKKDIKQFTILPQKIYASKKGIKLVKGLLKKTKVIKQVSVKIETVLKDEPLTPSFTLKNIKNLEIQRGWTIFSYEEVK